VTWRAGWRVVAVAVLLTLTSPANLTPAAADPTPSPSGGPPEAPLQVVVTTLLPRAPEPGDGFEVQGFVRNVGNVPVRRPQLRLRVGDRVTTRGGLHDADSDRPFTNSRAGTTFRPDLEQLMPGGQVRFDIRTTVSALGLSGLGVYPVDVEARGDLGDGLQRLGLAPTWVPFFAGDPVQRTRVAVLWPLVDQPRQQVDGSFDDDELATSLSAQGRLGRMLAAARAAETRDCQGPAHKPNDTTTPAPTRCEPTPVTYAVDADLVFAASTMSTPYKVRRGDRTAAGKGQVAATRWLGSLAEGAASSPVVALPYADPDVTALTRIGTSPAFKDDLARAALLSADEVRNRLGVEPLDTVAWPPAGPLTAQAIDALTLVGARTFVLDPSAYGQPDTEPYPTPSARTLLPTSSQGTALEGLVTDAYLSDLVTGPLAETLGPRLAEQRFLAETAIIAAESPGLARTLVLAPERRGDVVVGAAAAALRDLGRVPWLCPVTLASVAARAERCADRSEAAVPEAKDRGPLSTSRTGELGQGYLAGIGTDREHASQLTDAVLSDRPAAQKRVAAIKSRLRRSIARAESSAWRNNTAAARGSAAALHREVRRLVEKVKVYGGQVLLTSTKGTLQVSLENTLDVPIEVRVRFDAPGDALLRTETRLIEVGPGSAVPASVRAETQKSGQFVVRAQIYDREGHPFNDVKGFGLAEVIVRSTGYGRLALAVTAGGASVLFVAAGIRIVRRARSRTESTRPT